MTVSRANAQAFTTPYTRHYYAVSGRETKVVALIGVGSAGFKIVFVAFTADAVDMKCAYVPLYRCFVRSLLWYCAVPVDTGV